MSSSVKSRDCRFKPNCNKVQLTNSFLNPFEDQTSTNKVFLIILECPPPYPPPPFVSLKLSRYLHLLAHSVTNLQTFPSITQQKCPFTSLHYDVTNLHKHTPRLKCDICEFLLTHLILNTNYKLLLLKVP
jgi:hypothetical protein